MIADVEVGSRGASAPFFVAKIYKSPSMVHPTKGRVDVQSESSSS
jgi:hypothetical protein